MSEAITTARPYAQAAFDAAQSQANLKGWSEALLTLADAVCHLELKAVISSPKVSQAAIEGLMDGLLGNSADTQLRNFVRVLVDKKRLNVLPEIAVIFESLRAEAEKTVNVVVDSAFELSVVQQEKIISSLKKSMGRDIKLVCKVNEELLGGVVIRAGDKVIDGSARTRLGEMATALA
jgi:F-type H+-transporting ATPase subunit delta